MHMYRSTHKHVWLLITCLYVVILLAWTLEYKRKPSHVQERLAPDCSVNRNPIVLLTDRTVKNLILSPSNQLHSSITANLLSQQLIIYQESPTTSVHIIISAFNPKKLPLTLTATCHVYWHEGGATCQSHEIH